VPDSIERWFAQSVRPRVRREATRDLHSLLALEAHRTRMSPGQGLDVALQRQGLASSSGSLSNGPDSGGRDPGSSVVSRSM